MSDRAVYNFAYLDEQTKRMIRRAILKAIAIPGYQVPFASREMPMPYGWGTGGVQVTAAVLGVCADAAQLQLLLTAALQAQGARSPHAVLATSPAHRGVGLRPADRQSQAKGLILSEGRAFC